MNVHNRTQANLNAYPLNNGFVSACMNTPVPPDPIPVPAVEDIDSLCLRSVADGDQRAFASLVERWQSHLINFFYRSTGNRDDAEDLAQETFLDLYRAAPRYEARSSFKRARNRHNEVLLAVLILCESCGFILERINHFLRKLIAIDNK